MPESLSREPGGTEPIKQASDLKIVEIGEKPFIQHAFPNQVRYFSTWPEANASASSPFRSRASLDKLSALFSALREPDLSLIVCHPAFFSPWHWRWISRTLFDRKMMQRIRSFPRAIGPQLLRWPVAAPIVALDHEDLPVINRNNFFLLDRCNVYFKRELPPDRWRLFLKTGHANLPTPRFRQNAGHRAWLAKLQPISLGLPLTTPEPFPVGCAEKTTDIFFAGRIDASSSVRRRGLPELIALREHGVVVDIAEAPLPRAEFYRRCAQARLTWSPEGLGWDCFRHYEAAACGSVPLMSQPTIERHRPLLQGIHAIYHDIEQGGLTRAVLAALGDRPRLEAIGRAARGHVLAHHTPTALARHIVRASLEHADDRFRGDAAGNSVFTGARC